jgi:phage shock protein E
MKRRSVFPILTLLFILVACSRADAGPTNSPPAQSGPKSSPQLVGLDEAEKLIADKQVVILDVRTPAEFAAGHIAGATNLDFHDKDFQAKLEKLNKNQTYLVHCAVGGRSARAVKLMSQHEFKSVYDLKGGIQAWQKAGKPVEK